MSFDDLFGLLLFLVFIVLPALSRMAGKGKQTPPGGPRPPATGRATGGPAPTASTSTAGAGGRPATAPPADDLERMLAEARERVRRAMEGPGSSAPTQPSASAPASAPSPPPRPRPTLVRDRDDGLLSTPLDPALTATLGRERPKPRVDLRSGRVASEQAPALQVERLVRGEGRRASAPVFATDPSSIASAIVWHQVLGEPRARRPLGGPSSTLRSR